MLVSVSNRKRLSGQLLKETAAAEFSFRMAVPKESWAPALSTF